MLHEMQHQTTVSPYGGKKSVDILGKFLREIRADRAADKEVAEYAACNARADNGKSLWREKTLTFLVVLREIRACRAADADTGAAEYAA